MIQNSELLEWDSIFFGFPVASIKVGAGNENEVKTELDKFLNSGCKLIYIFSKNPLDLSGYHSCMVDRKRSYVLKTPIFMENVTHPVKIEHNAELLYELAYQAGVHSRYKCDSHISEETFERLYRIWIDNSVNKGFADYVLAIIDEDKAVGFITARKNANQLSIGLIATDKESRGKGIGTNLIQEIVNIGAIENLQVEVTTQADNLPAYGIGVLDQAHHIVHGHVGEVES